MKTCPRSRIVSVRQLATLLAAVGVCVLLAGFALPRAFGAEAASKTDSVLDAFVAHITAGESFEAKQKEAALSAVSSLREDPYLRSAAVTEGLCELYPDYRAALEGLGEEKLDAAIESLQRMSAHEDPYLASDASFYLARALMIEERYEGAVSLLDNVMGKWGDNSLQTSEALFLRGVCHARMLQREQAIESLTRYLNENPDAPERMRIGAWRQLQLLQSVEEGSLSDVYDRMDFSRRRLSLEDSGDKTQDEQQKIIDMLAKLIEEAEEKECNCQGGGSGIKPGQGQSGSSGRGNGMGQGGGGGNNQDEGDVVRRVFGSGPQSPWSKLRDKDRDPAYSAIKANFPGRYEKLIEQYYKAFQDEPNMP